MHFVGPFWCSDGKIRVGHRAPFGSDNRPMKHTLATSPGNGDDKPADKNSKSDRSGSLQEQLSFKSRFVLVFGEVDDKLARITCERLIALSQESDAPIQLLISSPGGHVESGDAIHDIVRFVRAPVTTIGTGWVASAGTHIFLAAPKERRVCLPNTRFMIHQPAGGAGGRASDIAIQAREIIKVRERIAKTVAAQTGQKLDKVLADMERDYWMSADEAVAYGIVSRVIERQADLS
jgi:ATP-dependent Clp protease protease subunit